MLFAVLALSVVVPYELIVLAVAGSSAFGGSYVGATTAVALTLFDVLLLTALISALHNHAVLDIGRGQQPRLIDVAPRGLAVLWVVAAVEVVAGIGIMLGLLLLIVPGVLLVIRWAVVAQVAAVEHVDWLGALRSSGDLASRNYGYVLAFVLCLALIGFGLQRAAVALSSSSVHAPQIVLVIVVIAFSRSFEALTLALLYFDRTARAARSQTTTV